MRLVRAHALGACLLALALPATGQGEPPTNVEVLAGAGGLVAPEASVAGYARVGIEGALYVGSSPLARYDVLLGLGAIPGAAIDFDGTKTFRSGEFEVRLKRRIGSSSGGLSSTYLHVQAGWLTRIPGAQDPLDRYARVYGAGITIEGRASPDTRKAAPGKVERSLSIAYAWTDGVAEPQGRGAGAIVVAGRVDIAVAGRRLTIVGDAHLRVSRDIRREMDAKPALDMMRLFFAGGWG